MDRINKKLVQIINFPGFLNSECLIRVFIEFAEALKIDYNWEIKIVNKKEDLEDNGIILASHIDKKIDSVDYFVNILTKFTKAIFIGWYWKPHFPLHYLFKRLIYTSEEKLDPIPSDIELFKELKNTINYVPLLLRANEPIETVGINERTDERIYCFMGCPYGTDMIPTKYTGIYHNVHNGGYLDYPTRKKIYLSSVIALGYHGDEPIKQKSFSQRIFEGMAYGCVVLTNSLPAEEYTDGICVYVKDKADVENKIQYYLDNPKKRKEKQDQGYKWVKEKGTNRYAWKLFFDKINSLIF
jgi:glycosyltransferase involved in cell wall biosynthesis